MCFWFWPALLLQSGSQSVFSSAEVTWPAEVWPLCSSRTSTEAVHGGVLQQDVLGSGFSIGVILTQAQLVGDSFGLVYISTKVEFASFLLYLQHISSMLLCEHLIDHSVHTFCFLWFLILREEGKRNWKILLMWWAKKRGVGLWKWRKCLRGKVKTIRKRWNNHLAVELLLTCYVAATVHLPLTLPLIFHFLLSHVCISSSDSPSISHLVGCFSHLSSVTLAVKFINQTHNHTSPSHRHQIKLMWPTSKIHATRKSEKSLNKDEILQQKWD